MFCGMVCLAGSRAPYEKTLSRPAGVMRTSFHKVPGNDYIDCKLKCHMN